MIKHQYSVFMEIQMIQKMIHVSVECTANFAKRSVMMTLEESLDFIKTEFLKELDKRKELLDKIADSGQLAAENGLSALSEVQSKLYQSI
jgi:hypothetical protein